MRFGYTLLYVEDVERSLAFYEAALENYQKALKIYIDAFGENHRHAALIYNNIGIVYRELHEYEKALDVIANLQDKKSSMSARQRNMLTMKNAYFTGNYIKAFEIGKTHDDHISPAAGETAPSAPPADHGRSEPVSW